MKFNILKIILWPAKRPSPPREVDLTTGCVNIISGASRTGKSAIIPIIDYCLGAERCAIPVETIRNACSWFGILVETAEGKKLFARREPGIQKSTGDMFIAEGPRITIPAELPQKNSTADILKTRLDELSGLSRLSFDFDGSGSGFKGRPSFRDLVAFTFQPQNIVANPDVLFFKADTYEHREKLKTIFPYVLGAVTPQIMAAQHELESLRRDLTRKQRELENLQRVSDRWNAELRSWAVQAREIGLANEPIPADASRDVLIAILSDAVNGTRDVTPDRAGIDEAVAELVQLQDEERAVDAQLRILRKRFSEMSKLKDNAEQFKAAIGVQRDRLAVSKWLRSLHDASSACPLCSSSMDGVKSRLEELFTSLQLVEEEAGRAGMIPAAFDREMMRVREELDLGVERMRGIALRKAEVEGRSEQARAHISRQAEIGRFMGRVERGLEMQRVVGQDGSLPAEIEDMKKRERALEKKITDARGGEKQRRALSKISNLAGRLIPGLDAERPNDPIELSIMDLSLRVKGTNREDYLWEIGSGANWLSYHIAVSMALQQFFIDAAPNPVPGFLVFDQPSQVYFPRRLAKARKESTAADPVLQDEDVAAVRAIITTLAQAVANLQGNLQVLVLDHAGKDVWGGISGVHAVEEWRGGKKLVPDSWL